MNKLQINAAKAVENAERLDILYFELLAATKDAIGGEALDQVRSQIGCLADAMKSNSSDVLSQVNSIVSTLVDI